MVIDTSTLVGAMLLPDSVPHRALKCALANTRICTSQATLVELQRVIARSKFDRYQPNEVRQGFLAIVRAHSQLFTVQDDHEAAVDPPCRDPKDNKFLALAATCGAEILVSSDTDLLVLHPLNGLSILAPAAFLGLYDE